MKVPTLLMKGEEVVEVAFSTWQDSGLGYWNAVEGFKIDNLPADVDGIVVELPTGCLYGKLPSSSRAGESLTVSAADRYATNVYFEACRVPRRLRQEVAQETEITV